MTTDQRLVKAVLENVGWINLQFDTRARVFYGNIPDWKIQYSIPSPCPDILNSLDAAAVVVGTLEALNFKRWGGILAATCTYQWNGQDTIDYCDVASTTARQRIEAFARVLNIQWEDEL